MGVRPESLDLAKYNEAVAAAAHLSVMVVLSGTGALAALCGSATDKYSFLIGQQWAGCGGVTVEAVKTQRIFLVSYSRCCSVRCLKANAGIYCELALLYSAKVCVTPVP